MDADTTSDGVPSDPRCPAVSTTEAPASPPRWSPCRTAVATDPTGVSRDVGAERRDAGVGVRSDDAPHPPTVTAPVTAPDRRGPIGSPWSSCRESGTGFGTNDARGPELREVLRWRHHRAAGPERRRQDDRHPAITEHSRPDVGHGAHLSLILTTTATWCGPAAGGVGCRLHDRLSGRDNLPTPLSSLRVELTRRTGSNVAPPRFGIEDRA